MGAVTRTEHQWRVTWRRTSWGETTWTKSRTFVREPDARRFALKLRCRDLPDIERLEIDTREISVTDWSRA